jgi:hypothetical protein
LKIVEHLAFVLEMALGTISPPAPLPPIGLETGLEILRHTP